jgi:hypothetical protein
MSIIIILGVVWRWASGGVTRAPRGGQRSHSGDSERDVDATTTTIYEYTAIG